MGRPPVAPGVRFWSRVAKATGDECWEWTGGRVRGGYGYFWDGEREVVAHRFAWGEANGPIPEGMILCHRCDNPKCVRVEHLFVGTYRDNVLDCIAKGRARNPLVEQMQQKTHCVRGHALDEQNAPVRRGRRRCRACRRRERDRMRESRSA